MSNYQAPAVVRIYRDSSKAYLLDEIRLDMGDANDSMMIEIGKAKIRETTSEDPDSLFYEVAKA